MKEYGKVKGFYLLSRDALRAVKFKKVIDKARKEGNLEAEKKASFDLTRTWAEGIFRDFDVKLNIHGEENIPQSGPVVYVMNHQGYFDIFAMFYAVPHQLCFIAKKEWEKIPILSGCIRSCRGVFIDRGNPRAIVETMKTGREYLEQGFSLGIFPEGTRSRKHEMSELKAGSFKLATRAGVPVVPVCIDGAYKVYEEKDKFVTGQTIDITFHEAIPTAGKSRDELNAIPQRVRELLKADLAKGAEHQEG